MYSKMKKHKHPAVMDHEDKHVSCKMCGYRALDGMLLGVHTSAIAELRKRIDALEKSLQMLPF
jgi:hypothetical protein